MFRGPLDIVCAFCTWVRGRLNDNSLAARQWHNSHPDVTDSSSGLVR